MLVIKKNELIWYLMLMIILICQGIRTFLNNVIHTTIFNYHLMSIPIILFLIVKNKNYNKKKIILIGIITGLIISNMLILNIDYSIIFRSLMSFILPLWLLLIDIDDIDIIKIFNKFLLYFNILIYSSFFLDLIYCILFKTKVGLLGHSLTTGWYYCIFLAFNYIQCYYIKHKKDKYIFKDIVIAVVGTVLVTGRISMISSLIISFLYSKNCIRKKSLFWIIIPFSGFMFLKSDLVDTLIWEKFRYAASWGDITNGRLLGIREMLFWNIYPKFWSGPGIGYSNKISVIQFNTINFENPLLMFSFDYGIINVILLVLLTFIFPCISFLKNRNTKLIFVYTIIYLIPFTYNGIAESIGLFIVLIMINFIFNCLNYHIKNREKDE